MAKEPQRKIAPAAGGLHVAASSASTEVHPAWAWAVTAVVVLAGGATLHAARSVIGPALDRWLPRLERAPAEEPLEAPVELAEPAPAVDPQPSEPEWTFVDIEASVLPLPGRIDTLIAEGLDEMPQFKDLDSKDETRALVIGNRWRLWGRVWHNRVNQIRQPMPPADACDIHAALEPTCRAVRESLAQLDQVSAAGSAGEARKRLEAAAEILEALHQSEEQPAAESAP